jgi:AraC-like DNA-binding protein
VDLSSVTKYDRNELGTGVLSWIYEYWNTRPIQKSGLGAGLEIGVQLEGEWFHDGAIHGAALYGPGTIHCIDSAEAYRLSFCSPVSRGVQIGFIVHQAEVAELTGLKGELRFAADSGTRDRHFVEFCRWFRASDPSARRDADARQELLSFVGRHCNVVSRDALLVAKEEIDATLGIDMAIAYFADRAAMHPARFTRSFKKHFGLTPANYRLRARLNQASRLAWSRLDWSIDRIAADCGFLDMSYFHRAYRRHFGCTPAESARRRTFQRLEQS